MKKYWTTKDGTNIEYKNIGDDHLFNILNMLKRKSKMGVEFEKKEYFDSGYEGDSYIPDFIWIRGVMKGKELLEYFDYKGLLKEAKKRD